MKGIIYHSDEGLMIKHYDSSNWVEGVNPMHYKVDTIPYKDLQDGEQVEFEIEETYIEPPPDIHPNRGGYKRVAKLIPKKPTWDDIFKYCGWFDKADMIEFLKENYHTPLKK